MQWEGAAAAGEEPRAVRVADGADACPVQIVPDDSVEWFGDGHCWRSQADSETPLGVAIEIVGPELGNAGDGLCVEQKQCQDHPVQAVEPVVDSGPVQPLEPLGLTERRGIWVTMRWDDESWCPVCANRPPQEHGGGGLLRDGSVGEPSVNVGLSQRLNCPVLLVEPAQELMGLPQLVSVVLVAVGMQAACGSSPVEAALKAPAGVQTKGSAELGIIDAVEESGGPVLDAMQRRVDVGEHVGGDEQLPQVSDRLVRLERRDAVVRQGDFAHGEAVEQSLGVRLGEPQQACSWATHCAEVLQERPQLGVDLAGAVVECNGESVA